MTRRLFHVGIAFLAIYGLLFFRLEMVQIVGARNLREHPQNPRQITRDFDAPRGVMRTADGEIVAQTVAVSGARNRLRQYPYGSLYSHVVGFISAQHGGTGIERSHNNFLAGNDLSVRIQDNRDLFVDQARTGQLQLSIRHDVQLVTRAAMAGHLGAAVVLEPTTGSVWGMWSTPNFDPNHLSSHDLQAATTDFNALDSDRGQPLTNRVESHSVEIGSLFTIVTAAAAIESNLHDLSVSETTSFPASQNSPAITNQDGSACGGTIKSLMVNACKTGWATIGQEIGREPIQNISDRFGLVGGDPLQTDNALRGYLNPTNLSRSAAHAAVGTAMELTPLQVAHLFATIANNGSRIQPRLVEQVRAHDGSVIHNFEPNVLNQSISKETAAQLLELLSENVKTGTAQSLALSAVPVAGMSASRFSESNHLWMVALAPVTRPEVVVAVLLEGDGSDDQDTAEATVAAINRRITEAVLRLSSSNLGGS